MFEDAAGTCNIKTMLDYNACKSASRLFVESFRICGVDVSRWERAASWTATSCREACREPGPARGPSARSTSCARHRCHVKCLQQCSCYVGFCHVLLDTLPLSARRKGLTGVPASAGTCPATSCQAASRASTVCCGENCKPPPPSDSPYLHAAMQAVPFAACCLLSACT